MEKDLDKEIKTINETHFIFPYSNGMKAFIFGNFDDKKAFRVISDDDIVEVLADLNDLKPPKQMSRDELLKIMERTKCLNQWSAVNFFGLIVVGGVIGFFMLMMLLTRPKDELISSSIFQKVIENYLLIFGTIIVVLVNECITRVYFRKASKAKRAQDDYRRNQILGILEKWNFKKFNSLGFTWKVSTQLDYIELCYIPGLSEIPVEKLPKVKKRRYPF